MARAKKKVRITSWREDLEAARENLANRERAVAMYGDDPLWAETVRRQLDNARRQLATCEQMVDWKESKIDEFYKRQIDLWEQSCNQIVQGGA